MATKARKTPRDTSDEDTSQPFPFKLPGGDPAAAQNIWLAGLGALASAQAEGSKTFETLVKQGLDMQAQTQALAKEQWAEATERMSALTGTPAASAPWDRLGGIFENRVARALASMGMPSASEVAELRQRVADLEQALAELQAGQPAAKSTRKAR